MSSVLLRGGQRLRNVHSSKKCKGQPCPIHNVSDHPFREWDQIWNGRFIERTDGQGWVRDPDDIPFNAVRCLICQMEIESFTVHDFKTCACGNVSVDGGREYKKRSFKTNLWVEL
jgi:hypothetical protein